VPAAECAASHVSPALSYSHRCEKATFETVAQAIAAHESPRITKLYDRTSDALSLDEVERIAI
jgi:hypothetical protein